LRSLLGLLLISLGSLAGAVALGTQGYHALTREDVAGRIVVQPSGAQRFTATLRYPDGREAAYDVAGDEETAARAFRTLGYYLMGAALDETMGYSKGPSAAQPVDGAFIARECPLLARSAKYFQREQWDRTFEQGMDDMLRTLTERCRRNPSAGKPRAKSTRSGRAGSRA
jgi:hypothetical protein